MAGSNKGKCKKSKGKFKSEKFDSINKQTGTSDSNPSLQQKQSDISGFSKECSERGSPSDPSITAEPGGLNCYEEDLVEKLLYERLEEIYKKALDLLSAIGYNMDIALNAILNFGALCGPMNILTNIVTNSIVFIYCSCLTENEIVIENEPVFENMSELTRFSMQTLVQETVKIQPGWKKVDAMVYLVSSNLLAETIDMNKLPRSNVLDFGNNSRPSEIDSEGAPERNVAPLQNVDFGFTTPAWGSHLSKDFASPANQPCTAASSVNPDFTPAPLATSGFFSKMSPQEWLPSSSNVQKSEYASSLYKQREDFKAPSKEQEQLSQEGLVKATEKLNNNLLGLRISRMEKIQKDQQKRKVVEAKFASSESNASAESQRILQLALDRERKNMKKIEDLDKQIGKFKEEIQQEKQKNVRLLRELLLMKLTQKQPEAVHLDFTAGKQHT